MDEGGFKMVKIKCKCGCGRKVNKSKIYPYKWNKYINGHNRAKTKDGLYLKINKDKTKYYVFKRGKNRDKKRCKLFMEEKIGRKLKKDEHIHHIDGNSLNDSINNLKIISPGEHNNIHDKPKKMNKARWK